MMTSNRLRYRFASTRYALRRWLDGFAYLPHQLSYHMRQITLLEACQLAGLSDKRALRANAAIPPKAIQRLAKAKAQKLSMRAYHSRQHIAQVIIAAGLLAEAARIKQAERDLLIVAALIHDFHHLGKRRNKGAYWQEQLSAKKALPLILRAGGDGRLYRSLYQLILATSPKAERAQLNSQKITCLPLLLDADLFASLFSSKGQVDSLTALLKYEEGLSSSVTNLRDNFMAHCHEQGFASPVSQRLHEALGPHHTYFAR